MDRDPAVDRPRSGGAERPRHARRFGRSRREVGDRTGKARGQGPAIVVVRAEGAVESFREPRVERYW